MTVLPQPSLLPVTDATFESEVLHSELPVVVDLWAEWCPSCHQVAPVLDELADELAGRVRIVKLNADENPVTASDLRVLALPTMAVFRAGEQIGSLVGARPKRVLREQILRVLDLE